VRHQVAGEVQRLLLAAEQGAGGLAAALGQAGKWPNIRSKSAWTSSRTDRADPVASAWTDD
jgi:hypothetical protein